MIAGCVNRTRSLTLSTAECWLERSRAETWTILVWQPTMCLELELSVIALQSSWAFHNWIVARAMRDLSLAKVYLRDVPAWER